MKKLYKRIISLILCVMLLVCCGLSSGASGELKISRISVCVNGDASSSRGLCWYTDKDSETAARVYENGADISDTLTFTDVSCEAWEGNYVHKLTVSGLSAGKTYTYRVGDGSCWSKEGSFTTDDGDDRVNFIAIADVQAGTLENFQKGAATLAAANAVMPNADFTANLGDFTNDSTNEEWDYYDEAFSALNLGMTLVPVAGNHDGLGVWHWFDNMFNLDTSESVQTLNGVNYSFEYGNAHFAVLNTNDMLSISVPQLKWLENDMNSTDCDWKIVFMHKSPYSLGKDAKWPDALYLQESLTKTLDKCGVDLVMSGHDHMYLRTKPLTGNKLSDTGTTYVLAGTAGSKRYEIRSFCADTFIKTEFIDAMTVQKNNYANYWNGSDWNSTKETNVGGCFNCVSIDGGRLTLNSYILADGGENVVTGIDTAVLEKQTGQNTASFSGDNSTSDAKYYLSAGLSFGGLAAYTFLNWLPKFIMMLPKLIKVYTEEGIF